VVSNVDIGCICIPHLMIGFRIWSGQPIRVPTVGITEDVIELKEIGVTLKLIDLAGQPEYYLTHEVFLRCTPFVYILVSNAMKAYSKSVYTYNREQRSEMGGWLSFLRSVGASLKSEFGRPSVFTVFTFLDKSNVPLTQPLQNLFAEMQSIFLNGLDLQGQCCLNYYHSGCEKQLKSLQEAIINAGLDHISDINVPKTYDNVADFVLQQRRARINKPPIMLFTEFRDLLVKKYSVFTDEELLERAMNFQQLLGEVMYDKNADLVILQPFSWLSSMLSHFVGVRPALPPNAEGLVLLSEIEKIYWLLWCSQSQVPSVMQLLCKVGICMLVAVGQAVAYLFPSQLPLMDAKAKNKNWLKWQQYNKKKICNYPMGRELACHRKEDHLPVGCFPKVQISIYKHFKSLRRSRCRLWKNAIFVAHCEWLGLMEWKLSESVICIYVCCRPSFVAVSPNELRVKTPLKLLNTLTHFALDVLDRNYKSLELTYNSLCYHCLLACRADPCRFQSRSRVGVASKGRKLFPFESWLLDDKIKDDPCCKSFDGDMEDVNVSIMLCGQSQPIREVVGFRSILTSLSAGLLLSVPIVCLIDCTYLCLVFLVDQKFYPSLSLPPITLRIRNGSYYIVRMSSIIM